MPYYDASFGYTQVDFGQDLYFPTWKLPVDHKLVTTMEKCYSDLFGEAMVTEAHVGSTNATAFAGRYGIPSIIVGPGEPAEAHKADEKLFVENMSVCSALYTALVYTLKD